MKAIKIGFGNEGQEFKDSVDAQLRAVLADLTHGFTPFEIRDEAAQLEKELRGYGLTKAGRAGARATLISGAPVAKRYRYVRKGQSAELLRRASGWYLEELTDAVLWPSDGGKRTLYLTEPQANAAVRNFRMNFRVETPTRRVRSSGRRLQRSK